MIWCETYTFQLLKWNPFSWTFNLSCFFSCWLGSVLCPSLCPPPAPLFLSVQVQWCYCQVLVSTFPLSPYTGENRLEIPVVEVWLFINTRNLFCSLISKNFKILRYWSKQTKWGPSISEACAWFVHIVSPFLNFLYVVVLIYHIGFNFQLVLPFPWLPLPLSAPLLVPLSRRRKRCQSESTNNLSLFVLRQHRCHRQSMSMIAAFQFLL